jgi:hypothetical protein
MSADLTFVFIVEPPDYQFMACTLLASIRRFFPESVKAIGYCPEHRMSELHPAVLTAHALMRAEIRPMKTQGMWDTDYPHGNKIIAAMQPRDSKFSAFVDSDVLFIRENDPSNLCRTGQVSCSAAASLRWAEQSMWDTIYGAFDMPLPAERVRLMNQIRREVIPYFSAGLVVFPEAGGARRFPDTWYETARTVDQIETLELRRPYLDQMTLPVAIQRAGMTWNILPKNQHFILGGKLRGKPLPADQDIYTLHYRQNVILKEVGMASVAQDILKSQIGVPFVRRLAGEALFPEEEPRDVPGKLE